MYKEKRREVCRVYTEREYRSSHNTLYKVSLREFSDTLRRYRNYKYCVEMEYKKYRCTE